MPTRSSKPAPVKRPSRLDVNQLAKRILEEATGDAPKTTPAPGKKLESGRKVVSKKAATSPKAHLR